MSHSPNTAVVFDLFTPVFKTIFNSEYINLGYWDKSTKTISQAQEKLVEIFGTFSKLNESSELIDVGCGTGEQDLYFLNHFHCKKILGINLSKVQIDIAKSKINGVKKYLSKIELEVGDALHLHQYRAGSYDRVLSLECAQYIDKRVFAQGAHHILIPKGYLCIADPLFNIPYKVNKKSFPNLLSRIKDKEIKNRYGFLIENKFVFFLQDKTKLLDDSLKKIHVSYDEHLKILEEVGFQIEEVCDISDKVSLFYPSVEKEILKILKKENGFDAKQTDLYLDFLVLSYLNYCAYMAGLAKFYLIRAMKIKG